MDLYLLSYNNYYNRQVKKFDTFAEYEPYIIHVVNNYNFVPGDGVNTILKAINYDGETQPDYALVVDGITIKSRWFVIDGDFIRNGQYQYTLHRDVIADNYDAVINAPVFVEKATLKQDDPAIFNKEDMSFNQIKSGEYPLKDKTNTPWIVGYIPSDSFAEDTKIDTQFIDPGHADITVNGIENWPLYKYTTLSPNRVKFADYDDADIRVGFENNYQFVGAQGGTTIQTDCKASISFDLEGNIVDKPLKHDVVYKNDNRAIYFDFSRSIAGGYVLDTKNAAQNLIQSAGSTSNFYTDYYLIDVQNRMKTNLSNIKTVINEDFADQGIDTGTFPGFEIEGQKIFDSATNTTYSIKIKKETFNIINSSFDYINVPKTKSAINNAYPKDLNYNNPGGFRATVRSLNPEWPVRVEFRMTGTIYSIELSQLATKITATVSNNANRYHLYDAPYDMFCMPYNDEFVMKIDEQPIYNRKFASLAMAISIGAKTGSGNVYDVQLLPYCPVRNAINADGSINLNNTNYNLITSDDGTNKYGAIIWCDQSNFTFDIPYTITVEDKKISNECDMYRICSPNYASAFEFSAAKNDGVSKFNVDCTYKPFNPYIHVNPDFKGLYGADYNDARGLILNGDFSLTQLNSDWANYELTNKNFQNSFDRRVENMETNNNYQRLMEENNMKLGIAQGAMAGGIIGNMGRGAMPGGIVGSLAGMAAGGALSYAAGKKDLEYNDALRAEALDYTKDQFGYQLGNIQAIPYTLAKTTAMTANNKLYPFLEYYTCTEVEKNALKNKLKYDGMTVMRIDIINNFIQPKPSYIKGKLIRLENLDDDFHMLNSISAELDRGIFI